MGNHTHNTNTKTDTMAHGGIGDLVAFLLIAAYVASVFFTDIFFRDVGPFKALTASAASAELLHHSGALLLCAGAALSTVKWNDQNGKMSGAGLFVAAAAGAWSTLQHDNGVFVPRLWYAVSALLACAGALVMFFPANKFIKTPQTKNNHGNASDITAIALLFVALEHIVFPAWKWDNRAGMVQEKALRQAYGGLYFALANILSGVKWNKINGKASGLGLLIAAFHIFEPVDYIMGYVAVAGLALGGLHLMFFPSNPVVKAEDVKTQ